ncbi:unnamed protein product [Clonostachys byssicola]|uniref:Partial AB-hydrolase lipase domain-containing protein n=1 Tax=Clonostachys byssicola TaxID=160290 RepID=A0A9N9Y5X2_9HYPO|nr:unnamed protein product [Clonostachys byssicola]
MGASTDDAKVNRQEQLQPQEGDHREHSGPRKVKSVISKAESAVKFSLQAQKLSLEQPQQTNETPTSPSESHLQHPSAVATQAHFVTPHDPVIITADGNRLPGVPLEEAHRLNSLRDELEGQPETIEIKEAADGKTIANTSGENDQSHVIELPKNQKGHKLQEEENGNDGTLQSTRPPSHTNPLFPPLPLYGPPSFLRDLQCAFFRFSSFFLSLAFLGVIVLGSLFTSIPLLCKKIFYTLTFRDLDKERPFYAEEIRRERVRKEKAQAWKKMHSSSTKESKADFPPDEYPPTEGGPDPIKCDVGYYARRVGLDVEACQVQTEDGFIIDLWHVYDPSEYTPLTPAERAHRGPDVFQSSSRTRLRDPARRPKFPVLLMHGLLQSAGAYCCNDDASLAFWLCKSGYDVWLGNNRCGFTPRHVLLRYADPRMWCWNIRQMGVFDLPALASRVLSETGFAKLGLVCHSQGTTQAFVALAKEQRPELGRRLTVFCALAPAVYAGPLIGKMYFKFMRVISPALFRLMFGIHAFIPFMMRMHAVLDPRLYGWLGYKVFSFLFDWTDERWDRGLRDRMFQFAPVYVSAESMRWWLGRECFAQHKCILATKEVVREEDRMDEDKIIPEYEHLDVIWAMDAPDQVFKEVREVLWKTCEFRDICRVPTGCEEL